MSTPFAVRVHRRTAPHLTHPIRNTLCTSRFCTVRVDGVLQVAHDLGPDELSDDLAELLADELDDNGLLRGQSEFEAVFAGVVETTLPDVDEAWYRFYLNSVNRLEHGAAAFAPVHEHAASLLVGSEILDLGSCFGFFPLRLAAAAYRVTATDLSAPTMALLDRMSTRLGRHLRTVGCDASNVPLPDGAADTVTVLHLIEHLDPTTADAVLREAIRLARRRVIVAVPFEDVPRACYGHLQRFDLNSLRTIEYGLRSPGSNTDARADVHEFHGGWLVLDL